MSKRVIDLANTIWWDCARGRGVYLEQAQIAIVQFPFATRQVYLRFAGGPDLDLPLIDMDRVAIEYLQMRGVDFSSEIM